MAQVREARAWWSGDLLSGNGEVVSASSIVGPFDVTWDSRTADANGRTSPEELLATAHASCFSMALANTLAKAGTPPDRLEVTARVTADKTDAGWRVLSSALTARGTVPGCDADGFRSAAETAKDGCPISQALKGNVELSVEATLVE